MPTRYFCKPAVAGYFCYPLHTLPTLKRASERLLQRWSHESTGHNANYCCHKIKRVPLALHPLSDYEVTLRSYLPLKLHARKTTMLY